jgi:hypothetical protein
LVDFEIVGWHGTDSYFSSIPRVFDPEWQQQLGLVVGRGLAVLGVSVRFVDDLFDLFYGPDGAVESFQLVKSRQIVSPPTSL